MISGSLYIHPKNHYSIEAWENLLINKLNDSHGLSDSQIDICLKTACHHYYRNNVLLDLLLAKFTDKRSYILQRIIDIPCYSFLKYQKLYKKEVGDDSSNKELFKGINAKVSELWKFESKINKKSFNNLTNLEYKLVKTSSFLLWKDYLAFIVSNRDYDQNYVLNVFERCLSMCSSYISIWEMYIEYLKKEDDSKLFIVYARMESSLHKINKKDAKIQSRFYDLMVNECKYWEQKVNKDSFIISKLQLYKHTITMLKDCSVYSRTNKRLFKLYYKALYFHLLKKFSKKTDTVLIYFFNLIFSMNIRIETDKVFKYLQSQNLKLLVEDTEVKHFIKVFLLNNFYNSNLSQGTYKTPESSEVINNFIDNLSIAESDLLLWKLMYKTLLQTKTSIKNSALKKQLIKNYKKSILNKRARNLSHNKKHISRNVKRLKESFRRN